MNRTARGAIPGVWVTCMAKIGAWPCWIPRLGLRKSATRNQGAIAQLRPVKPDECQNDFAKAEYARTRKHTA